MDKLVLVLSMDLTNDTPGGPGWYVSAHNGQNYVVPQTAISSEAAYEASRALQQALQSTDGELPQITLPQLAESGTKLIRRALEQALEYAETQAVQVALLRKKLAKLPPDPQEFTQSQSQVST